jgi:hypothetical protein
MGNHVNEEDGVIKEMFTAYSLTNMLCNWIEPLMSVEEKMKS